MKENPFKDGMSFRTYIDIARYLNVNCKNINGEVKRILNHCCEWHRDDINSPIVIDKIFDEVIPFVRKGFRYEVGESVKTNKGEVLILDRYINKDTHRNNKTRDTNACYYKCRCLVDGYEFEIQEYDLNRGAGCPVCRNNGVLPGVRSLYDTFPETLEYLVDPEEAKLVSPYSTKRIMCRCPLCGAEKSMIVSYLAHHGFKCSVCSDNISYPNKYIREFLNQIRIEYIPEKKFEWSHNKLYDQYIPSLNMIIENHGIQHFIEVKGSVFGTLAEQQENDKIKKDLALANGISHYIELDCRKSSSEWIRSTIMNSILPDLLNFKEDDIDWQKCDDAALYNAEIIKICEAYKTNKNISDLSEKFNHPHHLISKYLEIGARCGLCDYEKYDYQKKGFLLKGQSKMKPIYCVTDNIYFMNQRKCEEYYLDHGFDSFLGENLNRYINSNRLYKNKQFIFVSKKLYNEKYDLSLSDGSENVVGEKFIDRYVKEVV